MKKLINKIVNFFKEEETEDLSFTGKTIFDLDDDELFEVCVAEIIAMNGWGL